MCLFLCQLTRPDNLSLVQNKEGTMWGRGLTKGQSMQAFSNSVDITYCDDNIFEV